MPAALSFIALVEATLMPSLRHRLPFDGPLQKNKFVRHHMGFPECPGERRPCCSLPAVESHQQYGQAGVTVESMRVTC